MSMERQPDGTWKQVVTPCGCFAKIDVLGWPDSPVTEYEIVYCPMHAAAEEMLAACKAMHDAFIDADFPVTRIMDKSRLLASAAIAKAEGR